jgi:hypothetical protein
MFIVAQMVAAAVIASAPAVPSRPSPATAAARPAAACVAPEHTGTFRVTASRADGTDGTVAVLLLENIEGCLEATFITDGSSPAAIDHLMKDGDSLRGRLSVSGAAETQITLRFDGTNVEGSIVGKRQTWKLAGRKTS